MQFLGVKKWYILNIFSYTKQNMFAEKFVKSEMFLAVLRDRIIFNVK